ncbi:MAG: NAD(+)/NADH kinase [Myxococcota bacterium]
MILADPWNDGAAALEKALIARFGPDPEATLGVRIVLGGDGWMLRCVQQHGIAPTYLGLNAGRIGFLMNDIDALDTVMTQLESREWRVFAFPRLQAEVHTQTGEVHVHHALNDVYLERATGQTAHLSLDINDASVVEGLVADGLIFSTALGSTAYTFSAGGPACHPSLDILAVTAICPHHPRLSPFVLPSSAVATATVLSSERRPVRAVVDGVGTDNVQRVVLRTSPERVKMAYLKGHGFTSCMVTKILRP